MKCTCGLPVVKTTNTVQIAAVLETGAKTFSEIIAQTGMKTAAARSAIYLLQQDQLVQSQPTPKTGKMGRPIVRYSLQAI
jgi:predicted ArsR family transcriptional regulator